MSLCRLNYRTLTFVNLTFTVILLIFLLKTLSLNESIDCPKYDSAEIKLTSKNNLEKLIKTLKNKYPEEPLFQAEYNLNLPTIYAITPTYSRWTQKADLTRLCQTLLHVPNLFWIIVEDSENKSNLVTNFLKGCRVKSVQLNAVTDATFKLKDEDPNWLLPRGVSQRNEGLKWLHTNVPKDQLGVLYFMDDDNTYSLELFEEMRYTKTASVWPVGIVGGLKFEGPICEHGRVKKWYTAWKPERPFPIDMAGFAVNLKLVLDHPEATFTNKVSRGYQESHFLAKLVKFEDLEAKANNCKEILIWHTRTEKPKMKQEDKLIKLGKPSDPDIEV